MSKVYHSHEFDINLGIDSYVFRNIDPEVGWASRELALQASEKLRLQIAEQLPNPMAEPDKVSDIFRL